MAYRRDRNRCTKKIKSAIGKRGGKSQDRKKNEIKKKI